VFRVAFGMASSNLRDLWSRGCFWVLFSETWVVRGLCGRSGQRGG
jgi:hypothetical protein